MKEAAYKRQKERRAAKKNEQKSIEASAIKESDQKGKTAAGSAPRRLVRIKSHKPPFLHFQPDTAERENL